MIKQLIKVLITYEMGGKIMNRILSKILLTTSILILSVMPSYAAESVELYIDQYKVETKPPLYTTTKGEVESSYYIDVLPQVKERRTYIPISVISKFLGAEVRWEYPTATIIYNGSTLVLNIEESVATKDGKMLRLDALPYVEQGRIMVPLRFISEAFGLVVGYKDGKVNIDFPNTKGKEHMLYSMRREYWMTMGSKVLENKCDLGISRCYEALGKMQKKEIEASTNYGRMHQIDDEVYDHLKEAVYFTDKSGKVVEHYEFYTNISFGMSTGIYKLRDVEANKWYEINQEQVDKFYELQTIGEWVTISNTIV